MSTETERELRSYKALAASLTERLELLQAVNESAYLEAYAAHSGPHFCPDRPFGEQAKEAAA
ncbi:hypothetical protein GCM10010331_49910 [Streptomyces xanthochromogenes]|uniref:hypothetical protein n=1 Tax=Streptomyces xanthochromogenes TaxID=67384 RepID=UPI00167BC0A7|nr:hypothetical protein [Streptomyces xanthochromogenes]GHB56039.1 hypothetical protein GCM10010331_49910 [Streptomyces xanthochromogenes]